MQTKLTQKEKFLSQMRDEISQLVDNCDFPWLQSWQTVPPMFPVNAKTGRQYSGYNLVRLLTLFIKSGFQQPLFATYKQIEALGGQVRKGEHGCGILVFRVAPHEEDEASHDDDKIRMYMRRAVVFNIEQADGLDHLALPSPIYDNPAIIEALLKSHGVILSHGNPSYVPKLDRINMPLKEDFIHEGYYFGTLLHELSHWTKAKERLDRNFDKVTEEFIAEISAFMLCSMLKLPFEPRDTAAYLKSWGQHTDKTLEEVYQIAFHEASRVLTYLLKPIQHLLSPDAASDLPDAA